MMDVICVRCRSDPQVKETMEITLETGVGTESCRTRFDNGRSLAVAR